MIDLNTSLSEDENERITHCAERLRLIQADAANMSAEKRREYLKEELGRTFQTVAPANRARYLDALLARFPVGGHLAGASLAPAPPPPPKPVAETPEQLFERFLAVAPELSAEKRADMAKKLAAAGIFGAHSGEAVLEVSEEMRRRLGLGADQQPNLARMVELAMFLVDAIVLLDQIALRTMRELSPRSQLLSRSADFRKTAALFLTNQDGSLENQWNSIRALLGGLLAALQGGGKDFGRQFLERMSPGAIEDVIVSEGGKLFGPNKKERCWDRYKDLSEDMATADLVDRKIRECLAAFVERTVHGSR